MNSTLQIEPQENSSVVSEENKIEARTSECFIYIYSICLGVGVLCPWSTLLTTFDFFKQIYRNILFS